MASQPRQWIPAQDQDPQPLVAEKRVRLEHLHVIVGQIDLYQYSHVPERVGVDLVNAGVSQEHSLQIQQAGTLEDFRL